MAQRRQATPGAMGDFPLSGRPASLFPGSLAQTVTRRLEPRMPNASSSSATGGTVLFVAANKPSCPWSSREAAPGCWGGDADVQALTTPVHVKGTSTALKYDQYSHVVCLLVFK